MSTPIVQCPRCEGKGNLPLPSHLSATLAQVPKTGYICAQQLAVNINIEHGAACNRLVDLFLMGLVSRTKQGKTWLYSRPPAPRKRKP